MLIRFIVFLTVLVVFYFTYGIYISQSNLSVIPSELKKDNPVGYYDYRGITNVRTNLSNGSSSPLAVIKEARTAGLDFIFFTDINNYNQLDSLNGYNGNLLTFVAGEYSYLDSRLHFYSQVPSDYPDSAASSSILFADLLSQSTTKQRDSFVVLAHPYNPEPTWTGNYPTGLDGIEVINPRAISQKAWLRSKPSVIWSFITYPFNAKLAFLRLFREPREELSLWDKLSSQQHTIGTAGAEASARAIPLANYFIKFPSYQKSFEIMSNHVLLNSELTGNFTKDRQKIMTALKLGQFYLSLDLLGDPKGFFASVVEEEKGREKAEHMMGSQITFSKNLKLKIHLPSEPKAFYEIVIVKDGESVAVVNKTDVSYEIESPGVYRAMVRVSPALPIPDGKKWITWIYTNPFYIEAK